MPEDPTQQQQLAQQHMGTIQHTTRDFHDVLQQDLLVDYRNHQS